MTAHGRPRTPGPVDVLARRTVLLDSLILADSPWGFWKLNDNTGTTARDSSGNGRHATLTSATWNTAGGPIGDGSIVLTGAGYGAVPYEASLNTGSGAFTAEAVFRTAVAPAAAPNSFGLVYRDSSSSPETWGMEVRATRTVQGYVHKGSSQYDEIIGSSNAWSLDTWNHLVLTKAGSGGTLKLYLNGSLVGQDTTSAAVVSNTSAALYLGAAGSSARRFVGELSRCAFYLSELTSTQVSDHYAALTS